MGPTNETELEEILSRPSAHDCAALQKLDGDLLILGAGGKMGPSLARRARRAASGAGVEKKIIAVARFSEPGLLEGMADSGIETIKADLLEQDQLNRLPECSNVIFMAARKFGTMGNEHLTWAMNTLLPARVAERYRDARVVAFSTGNVYPLMPAGSPGATEAVPAAPVGEYAQSALGRERMFQYFSSRFGTKVTLLRLNYAIDLRYGVLQDIGRKVFEHQPVDLSMGHVNVIWQGDANSVCLRSFDLCQSPPSVLNLTGPEVLSVRSLAVRFGECFGIDPIFKGMEAGSALLSDAAACRQRFGDPEVRVDSMIQWTADWIRMGGKVWNKPTHFQVRDGRF